MSGCFYEEKNSFDIDLTSLLDVIFIVLMVVMCHQSLDSKTVQQEITNLRELVNETAKENDVYETQLYAYENANTLVAYVTSSAEYETSDPKTRYIQLAYNNDIAFEEITIIPENEEESYALFEEKMISFLSEKSDIPVILVLNEDNILYRDQVKFSEILSMLEEQYHNLYRAEK